MTFTFKIQIKGITKPPVWRKITVPAQFTFYQFHEVIQAAFSWLDCHLFQFSESGFDSFESIGIPDPDYDTFETKDAKKIKVNRIFMYEGQKYDYIYDFGDYWQHTIILEKITDSKILKANCLAGKGKCPPEDCGGIHGYKDLKEILANPKDEEYKSMREWLDLEEGETWDAAEFDLERVKEMVRGM